MKTQETKGFLRRLRDDTAGNTLALTAAAIVPLVGIIGGGLDTSRIYLAQARLQHACDSATLAARKNLAGDAIIDGAIPGEIKETADIFFSNNFKTGSYGTEDETFVLTSKGETTMHGKATVKVPTSLMQVFGYDKIDVAVDCSADLNLPNIDVVLVLDMSGSMKGSRIAALKDAVFDFYDEVMAVKPASARVRIGVVPYNGAVNPGSMLMAKNANFLSDGFTYQSREAFFKEVSNEDGVDIGDLIDETNTVELLPRNPVQLPFADPPQYHWNKNNKQKKKECLAYAGTYEFADEVWVVSDPKWLPNYWTHWPNNQKAACRADIQKFQIADEDDVVEDTYTSEFDFYVYKDMEFDTSQFKLGNTVKTATGTKGAEVSSSWNGCIEERQTVATTDFKPIPANAYDLDIDLVPSAGDPKTQWRPMWPQITYDRGGPDHWTTKQDKKTRGFNCPNETVKLAEYPLAGSSRNATFSAIVNGLDPRGGTMHDIGMIWAGRMISPDGIFGDENKVAPNGDPIARHIVFMTDGEMGASPSNTTAYGNYDMDGRMAGFAADGTWSENDLAVIHNSRLDAVCARIKNKNVTIWTVSFELDLNAHTEGCATGTGRAFEADNASQLSEAFKTIAGSIAELRLVE